MSKWFRWYAGTSEDGKIRFVARNADVTVATVIGVWAALLEDASHDDHRGIVVKNEDYFSAILDLDDGVMEQILGAMEQVEMISVGHGAITIVHWKERQFETDTKDPTNAERQRRHREKRKQIASVTDRNGDVTVETLPESEPDPETDLVRTPLPPQPETPPASEVKTNLKMVLGGRGGVVSAEARRKVCAALAIGDAEPLVKVYEAWSGSRTAVDPDALFVSQAPKFYDNAGPRVREACMPLSHVRPEIEAPPARPSSSLLAVLNKGKRHAVN